MKEISLDVSKHFGEKLRELRLSRNLTAAELSAQLNCSASLVYNIEKGRNKPQPELIAEAAEYFGVTTDYLLRDLQPMDEKELVALYRKLNAESKIVLNHLLTLLKNR